MLLLTHFYGSFMDVLNSVDSVTDPTCSVWILFWEYNSVLSSLFHILSLYPWQDFCLILWYLSFHKNIWQGILLKVLKISMYFQHQLFLFYYLFFFLSLLFFCTLSLHHCDSLVACHPGLVFQQIFVNFVLLWQDFFNFLQSHIQAESCFLRFLAQHGSVCISFCYMIIIFLSYIFLSLWRNGRGKF